MKAKLKKQGGFTLIEMLIVVAIIAILVAISIPVVSNALDKAKQATDAANVRSACAEVVINYLTDEGQPVEGKYNAATGKIVSATDDKVTGYGKASGNEGNVVWVRMNGNAEVEWAWGDNGTTAPADGAYETGTPVGID